MKRHLAQAPTRYSSLVAIASLSLNCGRPAWQSTAVQAPEASTDVVARDGSGATKGPGIRGVLTDDGDQPLENATILACMSTRCLFGRTEVGGHFLFTIEPPAAVALKTLEDRQRSPRRGALLVPVQISDDFLVDVGVVRVPALPDGARFDPANAEVQHYLAGDGLMLTIKASDLSPQLGDAPTDVAARRLPIETLPAIPGFAATIVAVYSLHPFGAICASPIGVRAPSELPSGTPVTFWTVGEIDGRLSAPAYGSADGASVATDPGDGIRELSLLVISR